MSRVALEQARLREGEPAEAVALERVGAGEHERELGPPAGDRLRQHARELGEVPVVVGPVGQLDLEVAGHAAERVVAEPVEREGERLGVDAEQRVRAVALVDVDVDDEPRRTSAPRAGRGSRVTTSLKTQNPRPTWANAWCVPPPRFIATPSASAARGASSVAPVARRERSTSSGDHGRPSPSSSRRSSRPSRTRSTQSAACVRRAPPTWPPERRHLHAREPLRALPHEPVLREREPVAGGERVRVDVVGEGAHGPTVACGAPSRPRRGLRD